MNYLLILTKTNTEQDTLKDLLLELMRYDTNLVSSWIYDENRALFMSQTVFYDAVVIHEDYTNVTNFVARTLVQNPEQKFIVIGKDASTNDPVHYKNLGCVGYLKDDYLSFLNFKHQLKKIMLKKSPKFINMTYE